MEMEKITSIVESILFASEKAVSVERFIETFDPEQLPSKTDIEEAIGRLKSRYDATDCGFQIRDAQGGFQMTTKRENADWVRKFLESKPFRLSKTALETLAIIAYRQPITRSEVDQIRGIDSSHIVRVLVEKGIVKMAGKADLPGRPVQYGTTPKFLELMGLNNLSALPPLSELKELQGDTPREEVDPIEKGMQKFIASQVSHDEKYAEIDEGLEEIDEMIQTAADNAKEVYESADHAAVAQQNLQAVRDFQVFSKDWKKQMDKRAKEKELEAILEAEAVDTELLENSSLLEPNAEISEISPHELQ